MKNKKIITLLATLGLITCLYTETNAVTFYDTVGTRYEGATERLGELGIINGISEKTFGPEETITRAEFAKMIVESVWTEDEIDTLALETKQHDFKDVAETAWYYKYVMVAANTSLINGYEDNTFRPDAEITYEQAAKIFTKVLGHGYLRETNPNGWSTEYMQKMYELNLADGTTTFKKTDNATRGNIAIMLWNTLTQTVWDKIELNDSTGFTYVDSGRTLFSRKIKGHRYGENLKVNGFSEIDNELYVQLGDGYYKFFDQELAPTFSMIGGDAEVLFKYIRYPEEEYGYEVVGLSTDMGSQLYAGTFDELKEEGFDIKDNVTKIGSSTADYGFYLKNSEDEEEDRIITVTSSNKRFYVESIKVAVKKDKTIKDEKEDAEKIIKEANPNYYYIEQVTPATKTITINGDYTIANGAVLFRNNKVVDWTTVEEGEIITEIQKDKYYFVCDESFEATITDYSKDGKIVTFNTSKGDYICYSNTQLLEYFEENTVSFSKLKDTDFNKIKGKRVKFVLDFAGKVARIEVLQGDEQTDLLDLDIGYVVATRIIEVEGKEQSKVTIISNKQRKIYDSTLKDIKAEKGDIVRLEYDEETGKVKTIRILTGATKLNDNLSFKKEDYEDLLEKIENGQVAEDVLVCESKYYYDFGDYEKVKDFELNVRTVYDIENYNPDKTEFYTINDNRGIVRAIMVKDYSEKRDIFYGSVMEISEDKSKMKIKVDIIGNDDLEYNVSGLLNCEEGDLVSFKVVTKSDIKILEKYSTKALGYYRDIIVTEANRNKGILITDKGEVNLKEAYIIFENKKYDLNEYTLLLLKVEKNKDNNWLIDRVTLQTPDSLVLQTNDRIAINEIEDTVIVYRGYKE